MAGTDRSRAGEFTVGTGPAVVLIDPQLGENIGTAARAMWNFGLSDLRLVRPRDGWPNERARAASSGADVVIDAAQVFETTQEAVADLGYLIATTARNRDMLKPVFTPKRAAEALRTQIAVGTPSGLLFGPERTGLHNDDVTLADAILTVPTNPAYASINLAQSVLLVAYELFSGGDETPETRFDMAATRPANREELVGFYEHLEGALDQAGFLRPPEKRPAMVRNIRNLFQRAALTEQEVRTLRGIVAALTRRVPRGGGPESGEGD